MVVTRRPFASVFDVVIDVAEEINHVFLNVLMINKLIRTDRICFLQHENNLIVLYPEATQDVA
jgi:hypothetical protein